MKHLTFLKLFLAGSLLAFAGVASAETKTAKSPDNRVVMLELYTSEGCSSCPPADRFLSGLKTAGISSRQLVPLSFHVTYWDYIGWRDRYADQAYDDRQRLQARRNNQRTIYTPQFMMSGDDYRRYASFDTDVAELVKQPAPLDLVLSSTRSDDLLELKLNASRTQGQNVGLYFAVVEHNLSSSVDEGENEGETLHHDYVVRQLHGPFSASKQSGNSASVRLQLDPEWKLPDMHIVGFAENQRSGEILQVVKLEPWH